MRILFINQFFWPELAPTSQLLTDVARHLTSEGHEVTVICARSEYAGKDSSPRPDGVEIVSLWDAPFSRSIPGRVASYGSFLLCALYKALRARRPEVVVTLTTPPLVACMGTLLKRWKGVRHVIWEMDMHPEISIALGMIEERSLTARITSAIMRWSRRHSDGIIALGPCMRDRLVETGVSPRKISICENWSDAERIGPATRDHDAPLHIVYPGNFGLGHDLETLRDAVVFFANAPGIRFTFIGGGSRYVELRDFCEERGIRNLQFLPYRTVAELAPLLQTAAIGLATQKANISGYLVPSKIYPLMAAGLGLLFIGPGDATPARIIRRSHCGWHFECGDSAGLIQTLRTLIDHPELAYAAGERARAVFLHNNERSVAVPQLTAALGISARGPKLETVLTTVSRKEACS